MSTEKHPGASPEEQAAERKKVLLEKRAERERAAQAKAEAHELLVLELEERFTQKFGPEGEGWIMANRDNTGGEGPIVLKLGDPTQHKLWKTKGNGIEDQLAYVGPSVEYPTKDEFNALAFRRPDLVGRAVLAMNKLFGFSDEVIKGKF